MARGNSRQRRKLAEAKRTKMAIKAVEDAWYNERNALIARNSRPVDNSPVARALRGEGFTSTVVVVASGGKASRGITRSSLLDPKLKHSVAKAGYVAENLKPVSIDVHKSPEANKRAILAREKAKERLKERRWKQQAAHAAKYGN